MIIEDILGFLRNVPPFQFLDEGALNKMASGISVEFYPKGSAILHQDGPPSEYLRIIKKGGAKVFITSNEGEEVLIDYRGEGDLLGYLSLYSADRSRANVVAVDDTICYLVPRETVKELLDTSPAIREFFHRSFVNKYLDKTFQEMRNKSLLYGGGEKVLFTTPVGDLATREVITAQQDISIREAAEIMSRRRISCLVLVSPEGGPVGIVTDRDLRDKVVSKGRDVTDGATNIMSGTLIKSEAKDYCFEALLKMIRYNIHHLLIVDEGKLRGIVTNHDLMMLQGTSPISLAREIESQQTVEGLMPLSKKINRLVSILLTEGAKASNITRIISEINDRLLRKVLELTERKLGAPPLPYCWIVFGSEGRKEQTFRTDQDNAIIYADPENEARDEEARRYFSAFAAQVRDALLMCGFPPCPAGYMASNPQWCQPLATWKRYFANWIAVPTADAVLKSLIFFDFRPVYGEVILAEMLRDTLVSQLEDKKVFLGHLASSIIKNMPPIGFLKSFVVEKSGEHKDELNLKVKGVALIVDIVRLFSLERGIRETSTLERLDALKQVHTIAQEYAEELEHAFEFIMLLRMHQQIEQIEAGRDPDNFINPKKLSNLQRKTMKDAFQLITKLQDMIIERYKSIIW